MGRHARITWAIAPHIKAEFGISRCAITVSRCDNGAFDVSLSVAARLAKNIYPPKP